jgi:hypothetical protein
LKALASVGIKRRTIIEILIGVGIYLAGLYLCIWFIENHPGSRWVIPIAMVPIVAIALALSSAMRYVRGMDELHQKMHLEALAFAFSAQWFILIAYGFLRLAGITLFSADVLAPIMMLLWCIGLVTAMWRYT